VYNKIFEDGIAVQADHFMFDPGHNPLLEYDLFAHRPKIVEYLCLDKLHPDPLLHSTFNIAHDINYLDPLNNFMHNKNLQQIYANVYLYKVLEVHIF
jgi:hypothetical protein